MEADPEQSSPQSLVPPLPALDRSGSASGDGLGSGRPDRRARLAAYDLPADRFRRGAQLLGSDPRPLGAEDSRAEALQAPGVEPHPRTQVAAMRMAGESCYGEGARSAGTQKDRLPRGERPS